METFDFIRTKFGFGFMRLPMNGDEVDLEETQAMVDAYLEEGFNYFDTAHGYINGKSELALKACLTSKYPREKYLVTDKLTHSFFNTEEDIRPFFESQLEAVGVDYFDFYLMHAQNAKNFEHFKKCRAYEMAFELKKEGKIRHVGLSFHDRADVLDKILTTYPEIEIVQIQLNYVDIDSPTVQSRECYEVCVKHDKPVIVMEPVRGGRLVNLPEKAQQILDDLHGGSNASYAIRYAAGFDNVRVVLSGVSNLEQIKDNMSFMKDFQPLTEKEQEALKQVKEVFDSMNSILCTTCRYCVDENQCPMDIPIPEAFASYNNKQLVPKSSNANMYYDAATREHGKASDCIECGMCEKVCPQHLPIRELLKDVADLFEQ